MRLAYAVVGPDYDEIHLRAAKVAREFFGDTFAPRDIIVEVGDVVPFVRDGQGTICLWSAEVAARLDFD